MLRKILLGCCLAAFSIGVLTGCTPAPDKGAKPATTSPKK